MWRKRSKTLREELKQSENSLGGYVQAAWSGAGPGSSQVSWNRWSGEAEQSIAPSGSTGTVEQVEPGSAVVDKVSRESATILVRGPRWNLLRPT